MMKKEALLETTHLTIDEVISRLGGFGPFQWILEAMICLMTIPGVLQVLIMSFAALDSPWKCVANSSICLFNTTQSSRNIARCFIPTPEWKYTEPNDFSLSTQFDLQCERKWMLHLLTSILFVGWAMGAIILGWFADQYGRKIITYVSSFAIILVSFVFPFVLNYSFMVMCRFVIGFFIPGASVPMLTIVSEYVGQKNRPKAVCILGVMFQLILCSLPLHAYFIRKWKTLMIVCTAPYFVVLLTYKFIPESIRWLRLKGRMEEVMDILQRIAYWNKTDLQADVKIVSPSTRSLQHKTNPFEIFKTSKMAIRTVTQGFMWLVSGLVYYGLVIAVGGLGGSLYLNFFLLSVIGIPGVIWTIDLCDRIGRKKTTIGSMFITCISCLAIGFIPLQGKLKVLRIIFAMVGKFCMSIAFSAVSVWSAEIYPTNMRSTGLGFLQVTSRIGAASAPWVAIGLRSFHTSAPYFVMAAVSGLASAALFLLPETKGVPTLETYEDVVSQAAWESPVELLNVE